MSEWKDFSIRTCVPPDSTYDPKNWPGIERLGDAVRQRKGAKYSEDQPRDELGRFGTVDVMVSDKLVQPIDMRTADGKPLTLSARALHNDLAEIRPGVAPSKQNLGKIENLEQSAERSTIDQILTKRPDLTEADFRNGHDLASVKGNLQRVADSAIANYARDPSLVNADKFYGQWNYTARALSTDTRIPYENVVAGLARMSSGNNANQNLREGADIIRLSAMNGGKGPEISGAVRDAFLERLDREVGKYERSAESEGRRTRDVNMDRRMADTLRADAERVRNGDARYMNDLQGLSGARFASDYRTAFPLDTPPLHPDAPEEYAYEPKNGFAIGKSGWAPYGESFDIVRGYSIDEHGERHDIEPKDVLDIKTGSFYNNIGDPTDSQGAHSLTVDFHMADAALATIGITDYTSWESSPKIAGVPIGIRASVADAVRDLQGYLSKATGERITSGRAQEILWAEINRMNKSGKYLTLDGVEHEYRPLDVYDPTKKKGKD